MINFKDRLEKNLNIIYDSLRDIDYNRHEKLFEDIKGTIGERDGKIVISGLGKNVPIAEKFVGTLNSMSIQANFMHTNTAMHGDLGMVYSNDIVILLSKSGNTEETIALAQQLNKRHCTVWLITFNEENKMKDLVPNQLIFSLEHEGDPWDKVPHNSTSVYLIYLQELAMALADWWGTTSNINKFLKNHPGGAIGASIVS